MNLPADFIIRTKEILGEEFESFLQSLDIVAPVSVRINDKNKLQPSDEVVIWNNDGYYLNERPLFTADPLMHAGAYYVQEASSMILSEVVKQHFPTAQTVLDLCAAPGGKSTLLSQCLPAESILVSNEIIRSRANILAENMVKWGNPNFIVSNNKPGDFSKFPNYFDAIVIDAPCSGEGMFRKNHDAVEEWSVNNVSMCCNRQKDIVTDIWDALKPGGILVYSTCTFNTEENEKNIQWITENLKAEKLSIELPENSGITSTDFGYRFYPHKLKGEGFFISVLKKSFSENEYKVLKITTNKGINFVKEKYDVFLYLKNKEDYCFFLENEIIRAFPVQRFAEYYYLYKNLNFVEGGIQMAEKKGKDTIPAQSLALSKQLDLNNVISCEVTYENAIRFLRKEAFVLEDFPKAHILITYKGLGLGWVKNLGNRTNNLYPQNWRIRMQL